MSLEYEITINGITYYIPVRMMGGIHRYVNDRVKAGDFLMAVFENDFVKLAGRADSENLRNLPAYASYLYNECPTLCHGSKERVNEWLAGKPAEILTSDTKMWQCSCGHEIEAPAQQEMQEINCGVCGAVGKVVSEF